MDQVHVIRHQVLAEGRSQRQVAKEFGISRLTVRKYVRETALRRKETGPRARPVWDAVAERVQALLVESVRWTGGKQRLTATRLHALQVAEGHGVEVQFIHDGVMAYGRRWTLRADAVRESQSKRSELEQQGWSSGSV